MMGEKQIFEMQYYFFVVARMLERLNDKLPTVIQQLGKGPVITLS